MAEVPKGYKAGVQGSGTPPQFVQARQDNGSGTTAVRPTFYAASTAGNCLLAMVAWNGDPGTVTPTSPWQLAGTQTSGSYNIGFFVDPNTAQTATQPTICASWSNSRLHTTSIMEISGADTTDPVDQFVSVASSTNPITISGTTTTPSNVLLVAGLASYSTNDPLTTMPGGVPSHWTYNYDGSLNSGSTSYPNLHSFYKPLYSGETISASLTYSTSGQTNTLAAVSLGAGAASLANEDQLLFTVGVSKQYILRSLKFSNSTAATANATLYIEDTDGTVVPNVSIAANSSLVITSYLVVNTGESVYWTADAGVGVAVDGIEVDV